MLSDAIRRAIFPNGGGPLYLMVSDAIWRYVLDGPRWWYLTLSDGMFGFHSPHARFVQRFLEHSSTDNLWRAPKITDEPLETIFESSYYFIELIFIKTLGCLHNMKNNLIPIISSQNYGWKKSCTSVDGLSMIILVTYNPIFRKGIIYGISLEQAFFRP